MADAKRALDQAIDEVAAVKLSSRPKRGVVPAVIDPRQAALGYHFGVVRDLRSIDEALAYLGKRPAPEPNAPAPTYRTNIQIYLSGLESLVKAMADRDPAADLTAMRDEIGALTAFLAGLPRPSLLFGYRVLTHV